VLRFLYGAGISLVFAGGSYTALLELGPFVEELRHPPRQVVQKVFVPPPKPAVQAVEVPEIPPQAVPKLQPVVIPGLELPPPVAGK
jgi:hypothetical protein